MERNSLFARQGSRRTLRLIREWPKPASGLAARARLSNQRRFAVPTRPRQAG